MPMCLLIMSFVSISVFLIAFLMFTCTRIKCKKISETSCSAQNNCDDCLQANEECQWCYTEDKQFASKVNRYLELLLVSYLIYFLK